MRKFFWLAVIVGSFFIFQNIFAANSDIIINEIFSPSVSTHQWVEIWNKGAVGSESVNLTTLKFWENNSSHGISTTTNSSGMIAPGEYAIICKNAVNFRSDNPSFAGQLFTAVIDKLDGREIGLKINTGNDPADFFERFSYATSTANFSLERINPFLNDYTSANWKDSLISNTAGAQNSIYFTEVPTTTLTTTPETENNITSTSWSSIKLNEIVSDQLSGNEWVELFNNSTGTFDLTGGYICDSKSFVNSECKDVTGTINSLEWLVVDWSGYYLNNVTDTVYLRDNNFNLIDELWYGTDGLDAPKKGQSLARKIDGADTNSDSDWAITTKITKNLHNEIVAPVVEQTGGSGGNTNSGIDSVSKTTTTSIAKNTKTSTSTAKTEEKDTVKPAWKMKSPYSLAPGEESIFSVAGTADPRGGVMSMVWNFGDKTTSSGWIVNHTFVTSGVYVVSVSAFSTSGTRGSKQAEVIVGPDFSLARAKIKFGEIFVKATSTEDEFFELKNFSTSSQNISGWKVKNNANKEFEMPHNTIIVGSSTLKFFRGATHLDFVNSGDEIKLFSPNDVLLDSVKVNIKEEDKKFTTSGQVKGTKISANKNTSKSSVSYGPTLNSIAGVLEGVKGQGVKIKGVVSVLPGVFGSQYFYIFDGQNGVQIYSNKKDFPPLAIGDAVEVNGIVSALGEVKRVNAKTKKNVDILATEQSIAPIEMKLEELGEDSLGAVVKVQGDITELKTNYMYIDDGTTEVEVYFKQGAKINKQNFKEGNKVQVIGILEKSKTGLQILPRKTEDIVAVGYSDEFLQKKQATDQQASSTKNKYAIATTVGLSALFLGFVMRSRGAALVVVGKKVVGFMSKMIKRG